MFKALQDSLLSIIYPQECRVCRSLVESHDDGIACSACWAATRLFNKSEMLCNKCGAFFGESAAPVPVYCHKCDDHFYDKAVAVGVYEKALASAVINLKITPFLAQRLKTVLLTSFEREDLTSADLLIPIPLAKQRKLERGFNQAEVITDLLARITGIPVDVSSLTRNVHTPIHRMGMDKKAREMTVKNAFEVVRPRLISGKSILLVDDVFTSGATASACAKILKKNGATRVSIFTLARAVMH